MSINLDRIANVQITRATRTASRRSFGSLMIAAYHTAWLDRVRVYTKASQMLDDGFVETDAAYLAAVRAFQQNPSLPQVKIGRRAGTPTQTIVVTVTEAVEGWEYSLTIGGETASYTAGSGDAVADIALGLVTDIGTLSVAVTATDNLDGTFDVAADIAGAWFPYTDIDEKLDVSDTTAEPTTTLATDLGAIQTADANWFGLVVADAQSAPQIEAVAAWAEQEKLVYIAHSMDSDVKAGTGVASSLKAASYLKTHLRYSHANAEFQDAGFAGKMLPYEPASASAEYKALAGCTATKLTPTEINTILGPSDDPAAGTRAGVYVEAVPTGTNSGTPITLGGLMAGGEWYDIVVGLMAAEALIKERFFNILLNEPKLPYTQKGIETLAGAVRGALREFAGAPYNLFVSDSIIVETVDVADVSAADKQARHYGGLTFQAQVQGAIRAGDFTGTVTP